MGELAEKLQKMTVNVTSPDRTVQLKVSRNVPMINVHPDIAVRHTESSLARQLGFVMQGAWEGYQQGNSVAINETLGYTDTSIDESTGVDNPLMDQYDGERKRIRCTGVSQEGWITLIRDVRGVHVTVERGAIDHFRNNRRALITEINSVMQSALGDYSRKVRELYRQIFGSNMETIRGV